METVHTVQISVSPKSASVLMKEYKLVASLKCICLLYFIHYVTGNTAKAMKCVGKKDDEYIGFGTGLSDKQIPGLGRQGLTPQTDTALPPY